MHLFTPPRLLLVTMLACLSAGTGPAPQPRPPAPPRGAQAANLRPGRIRVIREKRFQPRMAGDLAWDPPGEWLWFDLAADLPEGVKIGRVKSVDSAAAQDSTGKDLVGPLIAAARGDPVRTLLESVQVNDGTPTLRWWLAVPAKGAERISANLVVKLRTYQKVKAIELVPELGRWKDVEIAGIKAQYRHSKLILDQIEIRPAEVEPHIYNVRPTRAGAGLPSRPNLRSKDSVSYAFVPALVEIGTSPILTVFEGESLVEATLSVKDIELP